MPHITQVHDTAAGPSHADFTAHEALSIEKAGFKTLNFAQAT